MKTPNKLFLNRLAAEIKFQYGVWRTAIDWTVALYFVLPTIYVAIREYLQWWQIRPEWVKFIPFLSLVSVLYIFSWTGRIRIFIEEADQLFLWQNQKWVSRINGLSLGYSIVGNFISTVLFFIGLAPLLLWYRLSWPAIVGLAFFTALYRNILGIINRLLALHFKGWLRKLIRGIIYAQTGMVYILGGYLITRVPILFTALLLLTLVILVFLVRMRMGQKGSFYEEIVLEQEIKLRYAVLLLRASGVEIKKAKSIKKRPILFRRSGKIFRRQNPVNALTEACIKSVLRNKGHLLLYLQVLIAGVMLLLLMPTFWKLIAWALYALLINHFVGLFWRETFDSPYVRLFPWEESDQMAAAQKSVFYLMLPGFLIVSSIVGWQVYSWAGIPIFLALAVMGSRFLSQLLAVNY